VITKKLNKYFSSHHAKISSNLTVHILLVNRLPLEFDVGS